ncbi:hypothetical protein SELMODRAFT_422643 [Selaginella moellendorffii]|uniref:Uncharacterized protein n=1 Tax=Selaginella moellendorffii TaxID=88036 RepID=D8SJ29_SELML|nr:hypothetical protein SELMODRAFT_422643 [Selaginella moellendorffii]
MPKINSCPKLHEYNADSDESPAKKTSKKKAAKPPESKPVVSKVVEQLKQMIKVSGINIPPSVYKRVKQVPESKRESLLIKELESILQKEGLNRNSSEKELKAVRKKKDKQKDLEGIDVEEKKQGGEKFDPIETLYYIHTSERKSDTATYLEILAACTGGEKNPLAPNVCGDENNEGLDDDAPAGLRSITRLAKEGAPLDEDTYVLVAQKSRNITVDEAKKLQRLVQEKIGLSAKVGRRSSEDKVVSAMTKGYLALNQYRGANDIAHDMLGKGGGWCRSR